MGRIAFSLRMSPSAGTAGRRTSASPRGRAGLGAGTGGGDATTAVVPLPWHQLTGMVWDFSPLALGRRTVITPFRKLAVALSATTLRGSAMVRWKAP